MTNHTPSRRPALIALVFGLGLLAHGIAIEGEGPSTALGLLFLVAAVVLWVRARKAEEKPR